MSIINQGHYVFIPMPITSNIKINNYTGSNDGNIYIPPPTTIGISEEDMEKYVNTQMVMRLAHYYPNTGGNIAGTVKVSPLDYNSNTFQVVNETGSNLFNVNNSTPGSLNNPCVTIGNASITITGYEGVISDYQLINGTGTGVVADPPLTNYSLVVANSSPSMITTSDYLTNQIINSTGRFWFNDFNGDLILGINALKDFPDQSNVFITKPLSVNGDFSLSSLTITSDNTNGTITNTELSYLAGCTSNIQQQIDSISGGGIIADPPMTSGTLVVATGSSSITSTDKFLGTVNNTGSINFNDIANQGSTPVNGPIMSIVAGGNFLSTSVTFNASVFFNQIYPIRGAVSSNIGAPGEDNITQGYIQYLYTKSIAPDTSNTSKVIFIEGNFSATSDTSLGMTDSPIPIAHINNITTDGLTTRGSAMLFSGGDTVIADGNNIRPQDDGQSSCGTSSNRWNNVYAVNGIINNITANGSTTLSGNVTINDTNSENVLIITDYGDSETKITTYAPIYTDGSIIPNNNISSIGSTTSYYSKSYIYTSYVDTLIAKNNSFITVSNDIVMKDGWNPRPMTDGGSSCGISSNRWSAVYAINGAIQTSTEKLKKNIKNSDLGLDFIKTLKPKTWEWTNDHLNQKTKSGDNKVNHGFIFQDIEKDYPDFSGLHIGKTDDEHGLSYTSFIAPLVKAVQELTDKVEKLEKIITLTDDVKRLASAIDSIK